MQAAAASSENFGRNDAIVRQRTPSHLGAPQHAMTEVGGRLGIRGT